MEGPSGIGDYQMFLDPQSYEIAKGYATQDVNAAIRGIRKADAKTQIDIFDGHGMGGNIIDEKLEPNCRLLGGGWMTQFLELVRSNKITRYDAVLLLGQHAAAGTTDGFIAHTNTANTALRVNGKDAGEAPLLAWLFGHFRVPVVLVVGDNAVIREVKALLPGVEGVSVKKGINNEKADCISFKDAHRLIEDAAFNVIKNLSRYKPFTTSLPVKIEIFYSEEEMAEIASRFPRMERTGKQTVSYIAETFLEGWYAYNTCRIIVELHFYKEFFQFYADSKELKKFRKEFMDEKIRQTRKNPPKFSPVIY